MWRRFVDISNLAYNIYRSRNIKLLTLNSIIKFILYLDILSTFRVYMTVFCTQFMALNQKISRKNRHSYSSVGQSVIRQYYYFFSLFGVKTLTCFDIFINLSSLTIYVYINGFIYCAEQYIIHVWHCPA